MTVKRRTHWFRNTLIVLIICGLIGTALAAVLFLSEGIRTYAYASFLFSFDGAADGKAPNGYSFDVSGLTTDEVLDAALEASGLAGTYTAEQLRENLSVTGSYPDKIAEQMTKYVSLMDKNADAQAVVTDYHATQYSVTLYNDFDKSISSGKLTGLLNSILAAYRAYFSKTYAARLGETNPIADLSEYDYAQQLEAIGESIKQQRRYALEMQNLAPEFLMDQKSFGDIAVRYESLNSDLDRLNATVMLNAVSKDRVRLQKRYEMEIRAQKIQLESLTEELKQVEAQVASYDKDGIIYVSANGELSQVGNTSTDTYDRLVAKRKEVTDSIAETNAAIDLYEKRLADMTGAISKASTATDDETDASAVEALSRSELKELTETVEQKLEALTAKVNTVSDEFSAMLDAYSAQEINEKTVLATSARYKTPSLISGAFIKKALKTAGPLCAVGFMVCMVLLIISRRKEEKAAA